MQCTHIRLCWNYCTTDQHLLQNLFALFLALVVEAIYSVPNMSGPVCVDGKFDCVFNRETYGVLLIIVVVKALYWVRPARV